MKVNHLSFSYNHQSYMKDINIQFKDQKITTIIEPVEVVNQRTNVIKSYL